MTQANNSLPLCKHNYLSWMAVLALICATFTSAQDSPQSASTVGDNFRSAFESFVAAQQDALRSGDPDGILKNSSPVAVASLALLNSLDAADQESRKTVDALPYAQRFLSDVDAELMLLRMELSMGESDQAAALKEHILSTNPESAKLHTDLGEIFKRAFNFDDAVREAQRAADLEPGSRDAQIALGMAYWELNGFKYNEDTLHAFTTAHQIEPDGFFTNLLLGSIESQYHLFDDAALHLRAAIAADSSASQPWYQLGMNAWEESRAGDAAEFLEHYMSLEQVAKSGKPAQMRLALLTLDEIAKQQGKSPDSTHRAEEEALKQQLLRTESAEDTDSEAQTLPVGPAETRERSPVQPKATPSSAMTATLAQLRQLAAGALANIGTVQARKQDYAAAVVSFKYAAAEDPKLDTVTRNLGLVACLSGSYEESAHALKQVVAAHPEDGLARGYLGIAEFETGDFPDAAATYTSLGASLPSMPLFEATAAAAFARQGDLIRAQQALDNLKNAAPDPQVQAREASAYLDLGDTERAAVFAKAALAAGGQTPSEALRVLGLLDLEHGDASQAAAEFQSACAADHEGSEEHFECQALLADALNQSGRKLEGEELGRKLSLADPDLVTNLIQEGKLLLKYKDAQRVYEKFAAAIAIAPRDKQVRAEFETAMRALHISSR